MYKNPYELFGISPDVTPEKLRAMLEDYRTTLLSLEMLYNATFTEIKGAGMHIKNKSQAPEELLAKRYEFGLDFDKVVLDENELADLVKTVKNLTPQPGAKQDGISNVFANDMARRIELFSISAMLINEYQNKIESALEDYRRNPEDSSSMMDVLLELRYNDQKARIARHTAKIISDNGVLCSEDEFKEALMDSEPYRQLTEIYKQVATQEKRSEFEPESYVMNHMSDTTRIIIISPKDIKRLVDKDHQYSYEYTQALADRVVDPSLRAEPPTENQNHDFGWGIILVDPQFVMHQEPVRTPIFSGRMNIEVLGAFREKSLYKKNEYYTERQVQDRRISRASTKRGLFSRRPRVNPSESVKMKTIRDYFYVHEPLRTLTDNIFRVTKTDAQGISTSYIIFSPLSYDDFRDPRKKDFIKNVYCSDYMLDIAQKNGGYAGAIGENEFGYYISNKLDYEEIASAVLFQHGQRGGILDCRDGQKSKYTEVTKDTFMSLIGQKRKGELARHE